MAGVTFIDSFWSESQVLFDWLDKNVAWDERMSARKTASLGVGYWYGLIVHCDYVYISIEN